MSKKLETFHYHRFLDEAGDTTFFGKGKIPVIGQTGVSKCLIIGMVRFKEPLDNIRSRVKYLQKTIEKDEYFNNVPSIQKKMSDRGFYFHATDDPPEVRKIFYEFIRDIDCSFEAVVGRKIVDLYIKKHNTNEAEFYADLLSHLLKNKLQKYDKLVLNIAERGKSTKNINLQSALDKAVKRFLKKNKKEKIKASVVFNVQNQISEPLLNIADYFCWAVQRVFERGEIRYYNYMIKKIPLIIDLYDIKKYKNSENYYTKKNSLTPQNKISPL